MELRIGCAPDVPLQRLQAFLGALHELSPLEPRLTYLPTAVQLQCLREGGLHLGLLHDSGPAPGIDFEPLYRGESLVAVVSLAHRVAQGEAARLQDLAGEVLLAVPSCAEPGLHSCLASLASRGGAAFREIRESPGSGLRDLLFAVASGQGVTLAPRSALRVAGDLGEAVAARPLRPSVRMPDTCLAWSAHARSPLGSVFGAAREVARGLYRP